MSLSVIQLTGFASTGNAKRVRRVVLGLSSVFHTSIFCRNTPNHQLIRDFRLCNVSGSVVVGSGGIRKIRWGCEVEESVVESESPITEKI